jgi:hypothetical protein
VKNKPNLVNKVTVKAAYIHCPKALKHYNLWSIEHLQNIEAMPILGETIRDQTKNSGPVKSREIMLK